MSKRWTYEDGENARINAAIKIDAANLLFQSVLLGIQSATVFSEPNWSKAVCLVINIACCVVAWRWLMGAIKFSPILPALKKQGEGV